MAILQVRSMDDDLYGALGRRAAMDNRSISQEVVSIIKKYLAAPQGKGDAASDEALRLAGSWDDAASAEELASSIRGARSTSRFEEGF
jgi:plasmid stability protein